jgi:hypothetical protein
MTLDQGRVDDIISKNLDKLTKPGILTVRPGYEVAGRQLTGRPAIVATVRAKKPINQLAPSNVLPDAINGVPVDVREASPYQRLRSVDPLAAEISHTYRRPEDDEPTWPKERELPGGQLLTAARSHVAKRMKTQMESLAAGAQALTKHAKKQQLNYDPQGCPPLAPVVVNGPVTVAVSPDAGLATLTQFLAATKTDLNVGMYDFTSSTILEAFKDDLSGAKKLQMTLDNPAPNPTLDQSDSETVQDLDAALGGRSKIVRALTRSDPFASAWLFPYAYHIKVIARDGNSIWLSSGNLNNSNEPVLDHPPSAEDRDWHVIFADETLASVFAAYLDYDYNTAAEHQIDDPGAVERAIEEAHQKKQRETNAPGQTSFHAKKMPQAKVTTPARPVPAKTFTKTGFSVTPLLTPDKLADGETGQYLSVIMNLIGSAQQTIYLQLQYIEASKDNTSPYGSLLQAIADKIDAGLDVRMIVHSEYASKWGEKMLAEGVDLTANIRTMPNVHNKGFVVDSRSVVVSSQNFSPAGVHDNRDAGVLIESPLIAGYFEPIFLADWDRSVPLRLRGFTGQVARSSRTTSAKSGRKPAAKPAPKKARPSKPAVKKVSGRVGRR